MDKVPWDVGWGWGCQLVMGIGLECEGKGKVKMQKHAFWCVVDVAPDPTPPVLQCYTPHSKASISDKLSDTADYVLQNLIPTNKPGAEAKRPGRPVNITQLCNLSASVVNNIVVTWNVEEDRVRFTLNCFLLMTSDV